LGMSVSDITHELNAEGVRVPGTDSVAKHRRMSMGFWLFRHSPTRQ
jgi:hypothetical protein